MKFSIEVPWSEIKTARTKIIAKHQQTAQVQGFRKGKAPLKMVEERLSEQHIIEDILDSVLPKAYADAITEKKLKPLTMPKITPLEIKPETNWKFDVEIAQKPEVKLGDYKKYAKAALAKVKEPTEEELKKNPDHDPKLVALFDALLEKATCEVSQLLIEQEADEQLTRMKNQLERLGLTLEKYLESTKFKLEQLKADYEKTAQNNLKIEFILQSLIDELKIKVEDSEVDALIASVGDEHTKSHLKTPREREGISYMIAKRKVVEQLKAL